MAGTIGNKHICINTKRSLRRPFSIFLYVNCQHSCSKRNGIKQTQHSIFGYFGAYMRKLPNHRHIT